jgi:hypothetical protein
VRILDSELWVSFGSRRNGGVGECFRYRNAIYEDLEKNLVDSLTAKETSQEKGKQRTKESKRKVEVKERKWRRRNLTCRDKSLGCE